MASRLKNSSAAQAQTEDQVSSPGLTNGEIVSETKTATITLKGDAIASIVSTGNAYKSGKRAEDGKTYTTVRVVIDNNDNNKKAIDILNLVENFDGTVAVNFCEQDNKLFADAVYQDMVDHLIIRVGLRLMDKEDDESEILADVNFVKGVGLESSVKRQTLETQRKMLEAKARFFASSDKVDAIFSESLSKELQMKF